MFKYGPTVTIARSAPLSFNNVRGVGLGFRVKKGFTQKEPVIKIYVYRKLSKTELKPSDLLPSEIEGVPVDVIEAGFLRAMMLTDEFRPVVGGCAIGNESGAGTLGALGLDLQTNEIGIISNNHVISNNGSVKNVFQPPPMFGGTEQDIVAATKRFQPVDPDTPNTIDIGFAPIFDPANIAYKILPSVYPAQTIEPQIGMTVSKYGFRSYETTGTIQDIDVRAEVEWNNQFTPWRDQILTTKMSWAGDSGSLLRYGNSPVALCYAGSELVSLHNKLIPYGNNFQVLIPSISEPSYPSAANWIIGVELATAFLLGMYLLSHRVEKRSR